MRLRPIPAALFLLCAVASPTRASENDAPPLRMDRFFRPLPGGPTGQNPAESPVFISSQHLEGKKDDQVEAAGEVELHRSGQAIYADHMLYFQNTRDISAEGSVRLEQDNNVVSGPSLKLNLDTNIGDMAKPTFLIGDTHGRGNAGNLHFNGRQNYVMRDVSYTTCPAGQDDWLLTMSELDIDRNTQIGEAHNAWVKFKGVPVLYSPWMDFALGDQRKSGFLAPVFGSTVSGGSDLMVPYYWNISPNYDATLAPRIMTKRGTMFNNEVRYLGSAYSGETHIDVMPGDRLANRTRSHLSWQHSQDLGYGFSGALNLNRVSDFAYFRDFSSTVASTSQTNILREGSLSYGAGWWNASARAQSFQILQDPVAPITPPYNRLPQITVSAQRTVKDADLAVASEFVDFRHPTLTNARRLVLYPSVSYPLLASPAVYLTPKLGLHTTSYKMGQNNPAALPDASRTVPIFSLDSGVVMERDWQLAGRNFVHTLEPRLYYVRIPYRNQDQLPNFDSGLADFSFAQIFTENRFAGSDRIGDANQVTVGLTSRLLAPDSGAERLRVSLGQRFSSITPRVNLFTPVTTTNRSDILLAATGQVTHAWWLDSNFQYDPNQTNLVNFKGSVRYQPESGKVLNLGYRFTRNTLRQTDISTQWQISGRWHGVARWNYSFQDKRILETIAGLEYNQNCWTLRLVAQRFTTATQQFSTGVFIQLELNDLVAVGSDPLDVLRLSIPGYTKLNSLPGSGTTSGTQ